MGTWLAIELEAPLAREATAGLGDANPARARALAASEAAFAAVQGVEARLSTWREDSELSRLNRSAPGERFTLSPELANDLKNATALWRATDGAFDPALGSLLAAWGVRTGGRRPTPDELAGARAASGLASLRIEDSYAVREHAGLRLDAGGFGKGVGLDAAGVALREARVPWASLDLGGQVLLVGEKRPCTWTIAHPEDRERALVELTVSHGSFATSGTSERGAHLLDPRTGHPAHDFGSLTVWAADATTADALSTGLFVLGPDAALAWADAHADVEVLVLESTASDGVVARATRGLRGALELVPDSRGDGAATISLEYTE